MALVGKYTPLFFFLSLVVSTLSFILSSKTFAIQLPFLSKMPRLHDKDPSSPSDVLILGGGPAGLSAALTLYRHQHDVRIFDHGSPRNVWNTPIHASPTWEGKSPSEYRETSKKELEKTGFVHFVDGEVRRVEKSSNGLFNLTLADGTQWMGRKILLAMGVKFVFPEIPGYMENFPSRM